MNGEGHVRWLNDAVILQVYIQPRASRDEITGWHEKGLKIRLTAPPVDGAANKQLQKFIARQFKVPLSRVSILKGESSRQKTLSIHKPGSLPEPLSSLKP